MKKTAGKKGLIIFFGISLFVVTGIVLWILFGKKGAVPQKYSGNESEVGKVSERIDYSSSEGNTDHLTSEDKSDIYDESVYKDSLDLSLDLSEFEYYNRKKNENAEKYYPQFSDVFDVYSEYSYVGPESVNIVPQTFEDMRGRISEIDKNDEKYLYKGRKEDLFCKKYGDSITMYDSAPYKYVFGYDKPSKEVLYRTLDNNSYLTLKYKDAFREQIDDWFNYPGIDLTILNENLYTLKIMECSSGQLAMYAVSPTALACYRREENTIYVKENSEMDDRFFAILKHELTHSMRSYINKNGSNIQVMASYYSSDYPALYADEAMATLFTSYENEANLYPLIVNCYRIVIEACDYSVSDYSNHSVYELRDKINYYLHEIAPADDIIMGLEHLGQYVYSPAEKAANDITVEDLKEVLKLIIGISCLKNPELTAEEVFLQLSRNINNLKLYEDFLNKNVITELYESVTKR